MKYQFSQDFKIKISDSCCYEMKEKPLRKWAKENKKPYTIMGLMSKEGGRRETMGKCITFKKGKLNSFSPLIKVSKEWEDWFVEKYQIKLCKLYYPPYNFKRSGCKGCPYSLQLQEQLNVMSSCGLENERQQCEIIWKPIYEEYRRIDYRLKKEEQTKLF